MQDGLAASAAGMTEAAFTAAPRHLGEALEAAIALGAEREAIVAGQRRLSYGALALEIASVAAWLGEAGVAPGERVAVILPNIPPFAIAFFGIARAGAIALPLHASATETEIGRCLAASDVRIVVACPELEPVLRRIEARRGEPMAFLWCRPDEPFEIARSPGAAAVVGPETPVLSQHSTGQGGAPKRVTRTHGQLLAETRHVSEALGIGPSDRILGIAPLFHAYGFVNALLCSLLNGATLVLLDSASGDLLPRHILRTLASERVTGLPGVPFLFDALASAVVREPLDLGALRYCISAGAPLPVATAAAFAERFGRPVHQLYGTTEVGVISVNRGGEALSSVGFPIAGVTVTILDAQGQPVPDGQEGDVAIRSETAACGYDSGGTGSESVFRDGLFLPGDVGYIDPSGRLVLTGRKRRFINVGGNKVDPTEVEQILLALEGVVEVAVVGVPDAISGESVKAVVVAEAGCDRARLLAHCRAHLAPHKVPRVFQFRSEIPRSPLGKVLRKVLVDEETTDLS